HFVNRHFHDQYEWQCYIYQAKKRVGNVHWIFRNRQYQRHEKQQYESDRCAADENRINVKIIVYKKEQHAKPAYCNDTIFMKKFDLLVSRVDKSNQSLILPPASKMYHRKKKEECPG